jgi:hypothetical protein
LSLSDRPLPQFQLLPILKSWGAFLRRRFIAGIPPSVSFKPLKSLISAVVSETTYLGTFFRSFRRRGGSGLISTVFLLLFIVQLGQGGLMVSWLLVLS